MTKPLSKSLELAKKQEAWWGTDTASDRWCLTYNERAQLSEDTKVMYGVVGEQDNDHKESGRARMWRDEEKLVAQFQKYLSADNRLGCSHQRRLLFR